MRGVAVLLCFAIGGCTHVVDSPRPRAQPTVAPIVAAQVHDLLSPSVQDKDGNLFITVEPDDCSGVAREVDPPYVFDSDPAATDGGHWVADHGREVYIEEMAGVYESDYDVKQAIGHARFGIESCRRYQSFAVTSMRGREYTFRLLPYVESGSPDIVLWSFKGVDWACDNVFVAAHNAAVEISTCASVGGFDVLTLAKGALQRIETLANTTA